MMLLMLITVMLVGGTAHGRLINMTKEVTNLLRRHNIERSSRLLKASDMLEMTWDEDLAKKAGEYAEKCRYVHPKAEEYDLGSNLYYELDFVRGPKSVHRLVNTALRSWTRTREAFVYSTNCERACTFVQMIQSQTNKVGCAINTCKTLDNGNEDGPSKFASLFVCFYSPRQPLMDSFPFKTGYTCSECPSGAICRNGLCSQLTYEAVPSYIQDSPQILPQRQQAIVYADVLTDTEKHYLAVTHNRLRESSNLDEAEWDPYLEKWAQWIVNCNVDYPGPRHTYANFHRLDQGAQVFSVIYDWRQEGDNTNIQLDHGCRTPSDVLACNHYTNVLQPTLTSIACAAKDCKDSTRQLVCLYDNRNERDVLPTQAPAQPYRRPWF